MPHPKQPVIKPENPWDRQKREPANAYKAFLAYRDSRVRRYTTLSRETGHDERNLRKWAKLYNWQARNAAYDQWINDQGTRAELETSIALRQERVKTAQQYIDIAAQVALRGLDDPEKVAALSLDKGTRILKEAAQVQDEALGLLGATAADLGPVRELLAKVAEKALEVIPHAKRQSFMAEYQRLFSEYCRRHHAGEPEAAELTFDSQATLSEDS